MLKIIAGIVSTFALFWIGLGAGLWWEHRPAGQPTIHVLFFHWTAPASLAAKLSVSQSDLTQCHANTAAQADAINVQNSHVAALAAYGEDRARAATEAARQAQGARAVAESRAQTVLALKAGPDVCKSAEAVLRATP